MDVLEMLHKAKHDAYMRWTMMGMVNMYGKSPEELAQLRKDYDTARHDYMRASAALDAYATAIPSPPQG